MISNKKWLTPPDVAETMLNGVNINGKIVLEPSAGSGHLVRECLKRGAKHVLWCEIDEQRIPECKSIRNSEQIGLNFLRTTPAQVRNIDLIVMNPPFMADGVHILHAWDIAPPGCHIISLYNWHKYGIIESYERYNPDGALLEFIMGKSRLYELTKRYGKEKRLGRCFAKAELPSNVDVGMLKLTKPWMK